LAGLLLPEEQLLQSSGSSTEEAPAVQAMELWVSEMLI